MRCCIVLLLLLAAQLVSAATLSTGDGLALDFSAQGRVTAARVGKTPLPLRGEGGFSVCDFAVKPELTNLVPNGGFEAGTTGWTLGKGQSLDTTVAHSGQASAKLDVPGPDPGHPNLEVFVPVRPNTTYLAELWVRRHGVGVCGAYVSERDDANKLTGTISQMGVGIPKEDDKWLPLKWKFTTQPATTRLSFRADIYNTTGTLWVDDFFLAEAKERAYQPVSGKLTAASQTATFDGTRADTGVQVQAKLAANAECLRVDGVVQDTRGQDRAIGMRFSLPLDATGWTWWDDAADRREVKAGAIYRNTYECVSGPGECSIYPWSAITPPGPPAGGGGNVAGPGAGGNVAAVPGGGGGNVSATRGLSLALPLSQGPRVFILQHDQISGELSLTFFFGLTSKSGTYPSKAPFSFVLYTHDAAVGMRSAMERYYRLFPESFVKRPISEAYLNYAQLEAFDPKTHALQISKATLDDASDFGEGYKFVSHVHGCYDYRQIPWPSPRMMTDAEVLAELQKMVAAETEKARYYVPTAETIKKICRGPSGELLYIGDTHYWRAQEGYNHTDQPGWGLNFRVDEDPAVSPYLMNTNRRQAQVFSEANPRPWCGMFTADAIEGYMSNTSALDFSPEHLKTTLQPPTFGKDSLKPALVNTIWDFLSQAWWPITNEYKIATYGNANCYEQAFTLPYVDIPMTEGSWDPRRPARLDRYLRSMAHHKLWRYWHAWDASGGYGDKDPKNVIGQMNRGLAYGIYPAVYSVQEMSGNLEQYRALFRQHIPALEELNMAGWEPVPYATAGPDIGIERFGSFADGELHYTVRNWGDKPAVATLTLDRKGLGMPAGVPLVATDILHGMPQFTPWPAAGLNLAMAAQDTSALWIGTKEQAAQHGFRLAGRTLDKIERTFETELDANAKGLWQQALALAQQGTKASGRQALILAESLQNALGNLQDGLKTKAPVDLAKLIYRARVYTSMAPAALTGSQLSTTAVGRAPRGGVAAGVVAKLNCPVAPAQEQRQLKLLSPWPEVAALARVGESGASPTLTIQAPAAPPRALLPYLLAYRATVGGQALSLYAPLDVVVTDSVAVSVQPLRAFRGQGRKLTFTVTNALNEVGQVRIKLTAPTRTTLAPAEFTVQLPAKGSAEQSVTWKLAPLTFLGDTRLSYTVTGDQPQFNTTGSVEILVSDPVPQLPVKQTATPPVIDGKLDDAVWQQAPLIPELKMLANGGPATEKTAVWVAYDRQGLYVAMRCRESQMDKLVAKYTQRGDPLYMDDDVELFILPLASSQVFQFAINPNGAQSDNSASDNSGNKSAWKAAAARGTDEWTVEAFIPFAALGLPGPPAAGLPWGMQFGRQQKAKRETTSWTPGAAFINKESLGEVLFE